MQFKKDDKLEIKSTAHSRYRCQYHIVFAPKYRRKEIYGQLKKDIGEIIRTLCKQKNVEIIEKPVERLLHNPNGAIIQRGVGLHTVSGETGIKTAIQEGADVLLFDSIASIEELSLLLSAANSGMLVFATATGNNTVSLLNRFLDSVPQALRASFASSLADSLKGIIVQHLIPVVGGEGLVLATESLKVSSTIANLLRKEEIAQIPAALASAKGTAITLDDSLKMLVDSGYIEGVEAWKRAFDVRNFATYRPGRN